MRRGVFALLLCACGTTSATSSTFDAGAEEPPVVDRSPGPEDAVDASAPLGVACTPGSVRVIATITKPVFDGPRIDDGFVYWTGPDPDADADSTQGYWWGSGWEMAVFRAGKLGENPTRLFGTSSSITTGEKLPFTAVDATSIYWISYSAGDFGAIMRAAKDGSSPTTLVSGLPTLRHLELAGDTLFFMSGTSLYSIKIDGTNERVVAPTWSATELAIGASHVYALTEGDVYGYTGASIVRVARSGGAVETLVAPAPRVDYRGLSVGNDGYIYTLMTIEEGEWPADLVAVPAAEDKTPSVVGPAVQDDAIATNPLFTTVDGACVVYSATSGVFRRCGATISAIGPGAALEAPVVDSTSIYWRAHTDAVTTVIYAACKL